MSCQLEVCRTAISPNPVAPSRQANSNVARPPKRRTSRPPRGAVTTPDNAPGSRYTLLAANTVAEKP